MVSYSQKSESIIAAALDSVTSGNLWGIVSEANLRELITDNFCDDSDVESSSESNSDYELEHSERVVAAVSDAVVEETEPVMDLCDDANVSDEPLVSLTDVSDFMPEQTIGDVLCEDRDAEVERIEKFC